MIGANQYILTWAHFEDLHADKKSAFENLSRALFKREFCAKGIVLHSNPNHIGVEVTPVLSKKDNKYISFQAKYFDNAIDYKQIKKSIEKIIAHYKGKLNILYLYCNKDVSEMNNSYKDIEKMLESVGIHIVPVTGQSILDSASEYPSILSCYFGLDSLNNSWFEKNLQISLSILGRRYNALFSVNTDAQRNLSIFLRNDQGIEIINKKKKDLVSKLKYYKLHCNREYEDKISDLYNIAIKIPYITAKTITNALNWKTDFEKCGKHIFDKLRSKRELIIKKTQLAINEGSKDTILSDKESCIDDLLELPTFLEFQPEEIEYIKNKIVIVSGEMGTGKSHLLAISAKNMLQEGRIGLLLLGQIYISDENIEKQIMSSFEGIDASQSFESLLAVMDEKASLIEKDAVIFIDAINESRNRDIWKTGINKLISEINQYENIRLVISLRSGFEQLTLSDYVIQCKKDGTIAEIVHYGLNDVNYANMYEFLSHNNIPFSPEYCLQTEMRNPLFLTWFCQTYTGEEQGMTDLIENVIQYADKEGSIEAGLLEPVGMLKHLLYALVDIKGVKEITKQVIFKLPIWKEYGVDNKIAYIKAIERTGVLTSFVKNHEEFFYIGYNLLDDYLVASRIIEREQDRDKTKDYCRNKLFVIDENGHITNFGNESVFVMLTSLYATRYGEECIDIIENINNKWEQQNLIEQYIHTFAWRISPIKLNWFLELIHKYPIHKKLVWKVFIENATKENSELNAMGLTKVLMKYELNHRDYLWTIEINELDETDLIVSLAYFIEKGNSLDKLSENKVFLILVLFSWMLSSSNRMLRDRVSKAMIELMKSNFGLCNRLLKEFQFVNDPYILQRVYGTIFGSVMKRTKAFTAEFFELTKWIYNNIFDQECVYPDILLRDYARLIIERFIWEYPDKKILFIDKIVPPYKSEIIPVVECVDYCAKEFDLPGVRQLLFSMKFDLDVKGVGLYGDFGRYIFQSAISDFKDVDIANIYYYSLKFIFEKLGYKSEYFGQYDSYRTHYRRNDVKKIERIGKKYQWIAMYNILARLSDKYKVKSWDWNDKTGHTYDGPWKPCVRDFDPTLNMKIKPVNIPEIELSEYDRGNFLPIEATAEEIDNWLITKDIKFANFPDRLVHKDKLGNEWLSIYLFQENEVAPSDDEHYSFITPRSKQCIWTRATMYIVIGNKEAITGKKLKDAISNVNSFSDVMYCYSLFNREYVWSPGYRAEFGGTVKENINNDGVINAVPSVIEILKESGYDASQDQAISFMVPTGHIIQEMGLYQKDVDGVYYFGDEIVAYDLLLIGNKHNELVFRKDILEQYMEKANVQLFWNIIGEKQYIVSYDNRKLQEYGGYLIYKSGKFNGHISAIEPK